MRMRPAQLILASVLLAAPLAGCDGASLVGAAGALNPGGFAITRTNADPSTLSVSPGQSLTLSVETSTPADRYSWVATGGQLSSSSGNPVTWTAPQAAGAYRVDVTAFAGSQSAPASFRFTVK